MARVEEKIINPPSVSNPHGIYAMQRLGMDVRVSIGRSLVGGLERHMHKVREEANARHVSL